MGPGTGLAARAGGENLGGILCRIVEFRLVGLLLGMLVKAAPQRGSRLSRASPGRTVVSPAEEYADNPRSTDNAVCN